MSENNITPTKKSVSADWLVRGVLTKIGETFDRLTGRNWKPSSSLATSELNDRLKKLLDSEVRDLGEKGKFVPHNIKLKMQWDKFSTDAENALEKLKYELLTAAIDHINDMRYHTYAPMSLEIKTDYFTEGVKLLASFDKFAEDEREAAVNVTVPDLKNVVVAPPAEIAAEPETEIYTVEFTVQGKTKRVEFAFAEKQRRSIGRTKENDLQIDDQSISKIHAALVLNSERQLMVADTGSTNGTFINDKRIAYGKAIIINAGDKLKFGNVEIALEHVPKAVEEPFDETVDETEDFFTQVTLPVENLTEVNAKIEEKPLANPVPEKNVVPVIEPKIREANEKREEKVVPTEQRIVLDFGEEK